MTLKDAVYQLNALRGRQPLRALHLFAGAGGSVIAGRMLGWESAGAVELDPFCCRVLERHGERVLHQDITTFDARPLRGKVDVVVGGFPCQDMSTAGRHAGFKRGKRSILFFEMMRVVDETQAPVVFAENVRGLLSSHEGRDFAAVLHRMAQSGFDARWCLLGADDAGAPHQRKRVWILAHRPEQRDGLANPDCQFSQDQREQIGTGEEHTESGGGGASGAMAHPPGSGRGEGGPEHAPGLVDGAGAGVGVAQGGAGRGGPAGPGVAHAGRGLDERRGGAQKFPGAAGEAGQEAQQQQRRGDAAGHGGEAGASAARGAAEPRMGGTADGVAGGVDAAIGWPAGRSAAQHPWEAPRTTGRGVMWRVPRLRALGNGWVPQTAVLAWRTLTEERSE